MTFEHMERSVTELRDNQIVQGQILNRVELNLERMGERLDRLGGLVERNSEAIEHLANGMASIQAAMKGLIETVDRFIRGQEGDGHHR